MSFLWKFLPWLPASVFSNGALPAVQTVYYPL